MKMVTGKSSHEERLQQLKALDESKAGVKGIVDARITKVPPIFIRPKKDPSGTGDQKISDLFSMPVVDLADNANRREKVIDGVQRAAESFGMFQVVNHGIPRRVMEEMMEATCGFHELPREVKADYYSKEMLRKFKYLSNSDMYELMHAVWKDTLVCNISDEQFDPQEIPLVCRGRLKMNIDGAFSFELNVGGIGVIVRDEEGRCMAALYRTIHHASSAIFTEAEACRAGMILALRQGWNDFILESDCAALVTALNNPEDDYSDIGNIIGDCKAYMLAITSLHVRLIYREVNCVAHRLAHIASFSSVDNCWINDTPSIIEDVIYEDNNPLARGLGIKSPSMYHRSCHT